MTAAFVYYVRLLVRDCVTLEAESLTRHNFFSDKMDTTAWNDVARDPRQPGWLQSGHHHGSRNQMYYMRKVRITKTVLMEASECPVTTQVSDLLRSRRYMSNAYLKQ